MRITPSCTGFLISPKSATAQNEYQLMIPTKWYVAPGDAVTQQTLIASTSLSPLLCQLLVNRGLTDAEQAQAFLRPSLYDLEDPYRLHGMDRAIERLLQALRNQDAMVVYGDYDVDGVTGTALLLTFFRELGLHVPYYIPERSSEGYGLNVAAMHQLAGDGIRLLITVDCGITAVEEVAVRGWPRGSAPAPTRPPRVSASSWHRLSPSSPRRHSSTRSGERPSSSQSWGGSTR